MIDCICQHPHFYAPQETKDINWEIFKALIASLPATGLAFVLLRLDSAKRKRRSILNIMSKFSAFCGKYIFYHNEQEKAQLKFQLAKVAYITDKSKEELYYSWMKEAGDNITKYKLLRLNTSLTPIGGDCFSASRWIAMTNECKIC